MGNKRTFVNNCNKDLLFHLYGTIITNLTLALKLSNIFLLMFNIILNNYWEKSYQT